MNTLYIQYGCGLSAPPGWRNFDSSPTLRFERIPFLGKLYTKNDRRFPDNIEYGDIVKGLPVEIGSVDIVYCSHVLEHLTLNAFRKALQNTLAVLKPHGTFRLVLPDLEYHIQQYQQASENTRAYQFMRETSLGVEEKPSGLLQSIMQCMGNSQHAWMWDYESLRHELSQAGFTAIRRAKFMDNPNPIFREVEEPSRWNNCLGIECLKPE